MKRIISLFLIISVFFSLNSCTKNESAEDKKTRVINEATAYLKENYPDDEFTYISGRSPNWAYNYYELGFTSKNYDNQKFAVFGGEKDEKNDEGLTKITYSDDYYKYYMLEDAEKYFYDTAKQYLGEDIVVKVSIQGGIAAAEGVNNNKSFVENLETDCINPFVYIFGLNSYEKEKDSINNLFKFFNENKFGLNFTYYYVKNFSEIRDMDIHDIKSGGDKYYLEKRYFTIYDGIVE